MSRYLMTGFASGALLAAYTQAYGWMALGGVLLGGTGGLVVGGAAFVVLRVDRARLLNLLGELER